MLRTRWSNVKIKLYQRCFNVVSTSDSDVVSTLCNVENPASNFVSFSTSDQWYFNVDPTLKCWLGVALNNWILQPRQAGFYISPQNFNCLFSIYFEHHNPWYWKKPYQSEHVCHDTRLVISLQSLAISTGVLIFRLGWFFWSASVLVVN